METQNSWFMVREANTDDVDAVLDYLSGLLDERPAFLILPPTLPSRAEELVWMEKYMRPPDSTLLLAFSEQRVIGLLEFDGKTSPSSQGPGNMGMSVAKEERQKGVGTALIVQFLEWADGKRLTPRIDLHVYSANKPAMALYRKTGFIEVSHHKTMNAPVGGSASDIVRMAPHVAQDCNSTIRQATHADIPALVALNKDVHGLHVSLFPWAFKEADSEAVASRLRELLASPSIHVFLAEREPDVIGYLVLRAVERDENIIQRARRFGYVDQICVTRDYRGQGIGRALIERAIVETRQLGMSHLELDVWEDNTSAVSAFKALGFRTSCRKMAMDL